MRLAKSRRARCIDCIEGKAPGLACNTVVEVIRPARDDSLRDGEWNEEVL